MARPRVSPTILAARGVPVTLVDGTPAILAYTFQGLMELEERYGTLKAAVDVLQNLENGKAFTDVVNLISCGMMHEEATDHGPLHDPKVLAEYLDTTRLKDYAEAVGEAFDRAFPNAQGEAPAEGGEGPDPSRGASGTTSPPSPSAAPTTSSGA